MQVLVHIGVLSQQQMSGEMWEKHFLGNLSSAVEYIWRAQTESDTTKCAHLCMSFLPVSG